jgi:hypothetical protein
MLNLCGIVVAILKMATARNFSMSGINLGHHNLLDIVIGHHYRSNSAFSKFSRCLPFSKWLPKHGIRIRIRIIIIKIRIRIIIIKIIIRNGAKTISPPNFVWET